MFGLAFLIKALCILSGVIVYGAALNLPQREFFTLHKWTRGLDLTFPTHIDRELAINAGHYNVNRTQLPVDIDIEYRENSTHRTFLTIPRLDFGVPYSLATVVKTDNSFELNPKVTAYPSYEWHQGHGEDCTAITSALRTFIDECHRLWVIDSGQIGSLQWCPPQLLTFDTKSDQLKQRFVLPSNNYKAGISVYTYMVADVMSPDECLNTKVYIADTWGHGLIVYDMLHNKSWRIEHVLMEPDKSLNSKANDGIFTVSLSPKNTMLQERYLYFHSLNSFIEIRIPLKFINNESLWYYPKDNSPSSKYFDVLGSRGTQCESEIMDMYGNLYCTIIGWNALVRWKEGHSYSADSLKVMAYGPQQWRFVTGLKLATNQQRDQELWALSTEPKLFLQNSFQESGTMYQIIGCRIKSILRNQICSVGINV